MKITFPYEKEKAKQAVLWLLHRHGGALPILNLIKLIFYADRLHLSRYGRPITGGSYAAMPQGPVASELYNDLKEPSRAFDRQESQVIAQESVNEQFLSESDIEALRQVNDELGIYDGVTLRNKTHDLKAWDMNYRDNDPSGRKSFPLPYEDFFEDLPAENRKMLAIIQEDCEARAELEL